MTAMTISADKRVARRGETLIEIMASIMVLSIGLVGVLAAIPFGGFRMSQMTEADNSAAVGRNAVRAIRVNGWGNPAGWLIYNPSIPDRDAAYIPVSNPLNPAPANGLLSHVIGAGGYEYSSLNLTYPIIVDPLSAVSAMGNYLPYSTCFTPNGAYSVAFMHVSPLPVNSDGSAWNMDLGSYSRLSDWYEHVFFQQDDLISGYYASEDETEFRPRVETEEKTFLDGESPEIPSFSGRYSWLAFVYPKSSSAYVNECPFSSVTSADYDAVVFHDRIVGDEKAFAASVDGSGYQGGSVTIDLSTCRDSDNNVANSTGDYARIREQLTLTRYIMLTGPDDFSKAGSAGAVYPTVARWYKIANFANVDDDHVRLTLVGANTPASWANGGTTVTAVFYPGAIGVYSGSATF